MKYELIHALLLDNGWTIISRDPERIDFAGPNGKFISIPASGYSVPASDRVIESVTGIKLKG